MYAHHEDKAKGIDGAHERIEDPGVPGAVRLVQQRVDAVCEHQREQRVAQVSHRLRVILLCLGLPAARQRESVEWSASIHMHAVHVCMFCLVSFMPGCSTHETMQVHADMHCMSRQGPPLISCCIAEMNHLLVTKQCTVKSASSAHIAPHGYRSHT